VKKVHSTEGRVWLSDLLFGGDEEQKNFDLDVTKAKYLSDDRKENKWHKTIQIQYLVRSEYRAEVRDQTSAFNWGEIRILTTAISTGIAFAKSVHACTQCVQIMFAMVQRNVFAKGVDNDHDQRRI